MSKGAEVVGVFNPSLESLLVPIGSLKLHEANRRLHPVRNLDALRRSLERFGQQKPIVTRHGSGEIIAGNGTYTVALALGWTHVAAVPYECSDEEAVAYALADNRTAELAEWDWEGVADDLRQLLDGDAWTPQDLGWEDYEVEPLLAADWAPPEVDEGYDPSQDQTSDGENVVTVAFAMTPAQAEIVEDVIRAATAEQDDGCSRAEAIVHVCEAYGG